MNLLSAFNLVNVLDDISCGSGETAITIPGAVASLVQIGVFIIQVVVPVLLIIWGMLDFAKGVMGSDEDKIKAGQKKFIQRLIAAAIVFLVVAVVQLVVTQVGKLDTSSNNSSAWTCACKLLGRKC